MKTIHYIMAVCAALAAALPASQSAFPPEAGKYLIGLAAFCALMTAVLGALSPDAREGNGKGGTGATAVFLFVVFTTVLDVACTPQQKGTVRDGVAKVEDGCKIVEAIAPDGTPKSACMVADELGEVVKMLTAKRADAGPSFGRRAKCEPIADTALCATNDERLEAIEATLRRRGGK